MASFAYTYFKSDILQALTNLGSGGDDIRAALVMTNTTYDTEEDIEFVDDVATADEMDGAGYARVALTSEAVAPDLANDRGEFTADPITFSGVSAGSRNVAGLVLLRHETNDTDSRPIAFYDSGGFPFDPGGGDITITPNAEGLIQAT